MEHGREYLPVSYTHLDVYKRQGERVPKDYIPKEYIDALMKDDSIADKEAVLASVKAFNNTYPNDTYYP